MNISKEKFGEFEGKTVWLYTLENDKGMCVKATDYGGIITSLLVPDKQENRRDVVLGFDRLDDYLKGHPYFGAIIGRYANRIAGGTFELNSHVYTLACNEGKNHLHGGIRGFDKVVWDAESLRDNSEVTLRLRYISLDGEEGYPGNLSVEVLYILNNENNLVIYYSAETDKPTVLNLTHHDYFNLSDPSGDVLGHEAKIRADEVLETSEGLIPTGKLQKVAGTALDFNEFKSFGKDIKKMGIGYDHCFVLHTRGDVPEYCATVRNAETGIHMDVLTTEPGVQLYTANYLDGSLTGKKGVAYPQYGAFCLETQHFPDSPHHPEFPFTVLNPGERYEQETIYRFYTKTKEV